MIDLEISPDLFVVLGSLLPGPKSPVSPWQNTDPAVTPGQLEELTSLGVVDDRGDMDGELRSALLALTRTTGSTLLRASSQHRWLDHLSFAGARRRSIGLTVTSQGTFRLQDPEPTKQMVDAIARFAGRSEFNGNHFSIELPMGDALVLAAVADAQRMRLLSKSGRGQGDGGPITLGEIRFGLEQPTTDLFWIVNVVARVCEADPSQVAETIPDAIERLADSHLIETTSATTALSEISSALATSFLTVDSRIELDNRQLDPVRADAVGRANMFCLKASTGDLLGIQRVQDHAHLEALSSDTLLGYVERLLESPDPRASAPLPATHVVVPGGLAPTWETPNTASNELAGVLSGTQVRVLSETGGWAEVESSDGWQGWLDYRWLEDLPESLGP